MKLFRRKIRTLAVSLETERFELVSLNALEALRLTHRWRRNPEITGNLFRDSRPCSLYSWIRLGPIPDSFKRFTYAIRPRGEDSTIGIHAVRLGGYRTATMTVAIPDPAWRGQDVVLEVRSKLMDHFFEHADIDRFIGSVNSRNFGSIFNYRRLGFQHVGTLHCQYYDPGLKTPVDIVNFEIFRDRWRELRIREPSWTPAKTLALGTIE